MSPPARARGQASRPLVKTRSGGKVRNPVAILGFRIRHVPVAVILTAHDPRGEQILDALEGVTGQGGQRLDHGRRKYTLLQAYSDPDAFDRMLDQVAPGWRAHVFR
jgi:hypothetical protein